MQSFIGLVRELKVLQYNKSKILKHICKISESFSGTTLKFYNIGRRLTLFFTILLFQTEKNVSFLNQKNEIKSNLGNVTL